MHSVKRKQDTDDGGCTKRPFRDLIRSHRHGDKHLSENSQEVLQEAVFQLISLHQDTPSLVNEALQTSCDSTFTAAAQHVQGEGKGLLLSNVLDSLSQLESQPDQSVTLTVTESCARRLLQCGSSDADTLSSSQSHRKSKENFSMCIQQIQSVIKQQKFNRQHFVGLLTKEGFLSLETLWSLHNENILTLTAYISRKMSQSGFVKTFSSSLYKLCRKTKEHEKDRAGDAFPGSGCLAGILSFLINSGFPEKKEKEVPFRKASVAILDDTVRSIVDNIDASPAMERFVWMTYMEDSLNSVSFKKYCTHTLSLLMSHRPSLKVSQAFKQQTNWKFAKISDQISDLYKQLFLPFESREILEVLQRILERQEVNWQTVLSFIATFLVCYPDASKLIQGHVYELLSEGLEGGDMESTIIAFLLARQSCLEGLHVFPQYQDWFQQTFSDSNRTPASSRKSFTFLMKFLTNIVPYESANHLRVHILRPPHVPAKCRPLLAEYIILAKTRLTDLKESCEIIGGIYDSSGTDNKQMDPVEMDVERSLASFQTNGKVPSTIMEASIFRKPYFVGKYLQSLLKPRHLPDKPDTRMKMIESLKKADKIPASMYSKYEEACRRESKHLLEGVFEEDSEDDTMLDAMLSPMAQLQFRLEQLHNTITSSETDLKQGIGKVPEIISIISDKLDNLLPGGQTVFSEKSCEIDVSERSPSCEIIINLEKPDLSRHQAQVVDSLLNGICHTVSVDLASTSPVMCWLTQVIKMIAQHQSLHRPLIQRISSLVVTQGTELSQQHIAGLSALVGQVSSLQSLFGAIILQCSGQQQRDIPTSFIDVLVHCIQLKTERHMHFATRFLTSYLEYTFLQYETHDTTWSSEVTGVIPQRLVKLLCLLCWRLLPSTRDGVEPLPTDAVTTVFCSHKYQELLKESQVSPKDWVEFELNVCPEEDSLPFSERQTYYNWAIYQHFVSTHTHDSSVDVSNMCSVLLENLVQKKMKNDAAVLPPDCRKCHKGENSSRDNSAEILTLLQTLSLHLPPCTPVPWLVNHLQTLVKGEDVGDVAPSTDVSTQAEVVTVFRYVCRLPPHLLLVNRLTDTPSQLSTSTLLTLFENLMAPYLSDSCYLPSHLTLHIVQSVLTLRHCRVDNTTLKQLVLHPLVAVSILVHWPQVSCIMETGGVKEGDDLFSDSYTCITWAQRCIETKVVTSSPSPFWLCGSALFSLGRSRPDNTTIIKDLILSRVESQVVSSYTELCLLYLAAGHADTDSQTPASKAFQTTFTNLIQTFPELILKLSQEPVLETRVASLSARSLRKAVLLQSLCQLDVQDLNDIFFKTPDILASILQLYSLTCHQFEHAQYGQCLSLVHLSKCANILKAVLSSVSVNCLQSLDQEVVQSAGPDFRHLVLSRLRSSR